MLLSASLPFRLCLHCNKKAYKLYMLVLISNSMACFTSYTASTHAMHQLADVFTLHIYLAHSSKASTANTPSKSHVTTLVCCLSMIVLLVFIDTFHSWSLHYSSKGYVSKLDVETSISALLQQEGKRRHKQPMMRPWMPCSTSGWNVIGIYSLTRVTRMALPNGPWLKCGPWQ